MSEFSETDQHNVLDRIPNLKASLEAWVSGDAWDSFYQEENSGNENAPGILYLTREAIAGHMAETGELHDLIVNYIRQLGDEDAASSLVLELKDLEITHLRNERDRFRQKTT